MKRVVLIALLLLAGCQATPKHVSTDIVIFSQSLRGGAEAWYREASTRFEHPILVVGHGGRLYPGGPWCVFPDDGKNWTQVPVPMEWVAQRLRDKYPNRVVVIISCNVEGDVIEERGVYFAPLGYVWSWPGISTLSTIGRIKDFVGKP